MEQIAVNVEVLEEKIQKLRALHDKCDALSVEPFEQVGSGQSIEILQKIDATYPQIKKVIQTLLSNSVTFFEGVKISVLEADKKAEDKIK